MLHKKLGGSKNRQTDAPHIQKRTGPLFCVQLRKILCLKTLQMKPTALILPQKNPYVLVRPYAHHKVHTKRKFAGNN